MKKIITAGATDQTIDIFIQDSSSATGAGLTGLVYNTASLVCYYRKGATGSATQLSLVTKTVGGSHSDGGFVEISSANMPGMYRLDLSDTIIATAGTVSMMLKGAADMAPLPIELQVVAVNLNDAVRMGVTALPNANADAAGGLPISDAGGLDLDAKLANTNEVTAARMGVLTDWIDGGRLDLILDSVLVDTAEIGAAGAGLTNINLPNQTMDIVGNITGNLSGSVGSVTTVTNIVSAGAITTLAGAVVNVDTVDTLTTYTGNTPQTADHAANITAILADTNELQADWANGGRLDLILDARASQASVDVIDGIVNSILVDTAEIGAAGAGLTSLASAANLTTLTNYVDTEVAAILADTNELQTNQGNWLTADVSGLATAANLSTVAGYLDTEIAAILEDTGTTIPAQITALNNITAVDAAAAVWDRALTGATHNIATSAGRRLRDLGASSILSGTADAGAANSITLDSDASSTSEIYDGNLIVIVGGTGAGQSRVIVEYNGSTKLAIIDRVWETNPSTDSDYQVIADHQADISHHGLAQGGAATSITLSTAASATNDIYVGSHVYISTSTGAGQSRLITDYVGSTQVATVSPAWAVNPTSSSVYKIIPGGRSIVELLSDQAKAEVNAEVDTALADYDTPTNTEMTAAFTQIKGATWATTDTLEAIRDRGDAAWITATGFSTHSAANVVSAMQVVAGDFKADVSDLPTNAELTTALGDIPTANENADALLDRTAGVETGLTPRESLRLITAASAGKLSGAATTTVTIRNAIADSKDRITATVDSNGNRTAITTDLT